MHQAELKRPSRPPTPGSHLREISPPAKIKTEPGMMAVGKQSSVVGEQSSVVANLIRQKVFITSVYNKAIATAAVACGWAGTVMWGRGGGGAVYTRASVTCDWARAGMQKPLAE